MTAISLSRVGYARPLAPALRRRVETVVLLAPGVGLLALAMAIPIGQLVLGSFDLTGIGAAGAFTLAHYVEVLTNPLLRDSLLFSLEIALATAALSTAAAALFATLLMIELPGKRLLALLYKVPLVVPSVVAAFLVVTMIGPGGMAARSFSHLGMTWPQLIHDRHGFGVVIVLLWHYVPISTLIVTAVIVSVPADVIDAARTLGAPPRVVVGRIILPLTAPGLSAAALITFIDSFGAYAVPSLIGPPYPQTVAVMMTREFLRRANWGVASALGMLMCLTTVVVLFFYYRLLLRLRRSRA
ncbi:MAG TPA: ABC transporter permease subunit [Candidatus Acidoferrum sp.]|nr:ABC transporter permease subunit [Candidatus Acidoferrum sp.]